MQRSSQINLQHGSRANTGSHPGTASCARAGAPGTRHVHSRRWPNHLRAKRGRRRRGESCSRIPLRLRLSSGPRKHAASSVRNRWETVHKCSAGGLQRDDIRIRADGILENTHHVWAGPRRQRGKCSTNGAASPLRALCKPDSTIHHTQGIVSARTGHLPSFLQKKGEGWTNEGTRDVGIIPRAVREVFAGIRAAKKTRKTEVYSVYCSMIQVYNECIYDLLRDAQRTTPLYLHEDPSYGIYVEGLAEYEVKSAHE